MFIRRLSADNVFTPWASRPRAVEGSSLWAARLSVRPPSWLPASPHTPSARIEQAISSAGRGSFLPTVSRQLDRVLEQLASTILPAVTSGAFQAIAMGGLDLQAVDAGRASTLASTRQVTERSSTVRRSLAALALDTTSAEAASRLSATREVNESSSTVRSSTAGLSLDLAGLSSFSSVVASREVNESSSTVRSSSAAVGLDTGPEAASSLTSTGEANDDTTSYGTVFHSFVASTSSATLSGTYTGTGDAAGATSLLIDLGNNVTLSGSPTTLKFKIKDQTGATLFDYNASYRAGDLIDLGPSLGLKISFAAGTLKSSSSSTTTVSNSTPTSVDPTAIFNDANPNLRPRFESGATVTAGSFTVNGTAIAVNADDSIDSVLSRINSSGAGVTASFAGDKVTLTSNAASESNVVLGGDTSGFLQAVKLTGATTVTGSVRDDQQALAGVAAFAGVSSGSFQVNGVGIAVNTATDSLAAVLARVNASGAGVIASYDAATDRVTFTPQTAGATLDLAGDTTGLLAALNVAAGREGTRIDPTAAFNGTGSGSPLFDAGVTVGAGSFQLNGVDITVNANDSLDGVLTRINASAAGVTASYDAATDRVSLVSRTAGATPVVLGADSSGPAGRAEAQRRHRRQQHRRLRCPGPGAAGAGPGLRGRQRRVVPDQRRQHRRRPHHRHLAGPADAHHRFGRGRDRLVRRCHPARDPDADDPRRHPGRGQRHQRTAGRSAHRRRCPRHPRRRGRRVQRCGHRPWQRQPAVRPRSHGGAGSFNINGVSIAVQADDSLNSVLARINASGAGVTASFDTQSERLTLVSSTSSEQEIVAGDDTSGFLAAFKLTAATGAVSTPGFRREDQESFADSTVFGAVTSGSFRVNGVAIAIDSQSDSLQSVLDRITGSGAGVNASYDTASRKVVLAPTTAGATLSVDDDTTGWLAAAGIAAGTEGTRVNAAGAFNASGAAGPLLDDGFAVGPGAFEVNGVSIDVLAGDTLTTVLDRITASAAGVTASYDIGTETIQLTSTSAGPTPITLGNDTSGFLAATKLDSALASTPGAAPAPGVTFDRVMATTGPLAGVQAGTITINGQAVTVDPATQSVRQVTSALGAIPGVQVFIDEQTGAVQLRSADLGGTLDITDTSGLLGALGIAGGHYAGSVGQTAPSALADVEGSATALSEALRGLDSALVAAFSGAGPEGREQAALRSSLAYAVRDLAAPLGGAVRFVDAPKPRLEIDPEGLEAALGATGQTLTDQLRALGGLARGLASASPIPDAPATPLATVPVVPAPAPAPLAIVNPLAAPLADSARAVLPDPAGNAPRLEASVVAAMEQAVQASRARLIETSAVPIEGPDKADQMDQVKEKADKAEKPDNAAKNDRADQAQRADRRDSVARRAQDAYARSRPAPTSSAGAQGAGR